MTSTTNSFSSSRERSSLYIQKAHNIGLDAERDGHIQLLSYMKLPTSFTVPTCLRDIRKSDASRKVSSWLQRNQFSSTVVTVTFHWVYTVVRFMCIRIWDFNWKKEPTPLRASSSPSSYSALSLYISTIVYFQMEYLFLRVLFKMGSFIWLKKWVSICVFMVRNMLVCSLHWITNSYES